MAEGGFYFLGSDSYHVILSQIWDYQSRTGGRGSPGLVGSFHPRPVGWEEEIPPPKDVFKLLLVKLEEPP